MRGNPNTYIISESGLYSLILRSRKPIARGFKRWITHEVIPSVRKTGKYDLADMSMKA
jgi:prophage antirepressor-like protein